MRLLNSSTPEMKEFLSEDNVPPYAIVSHRWGKEEVEFRDWQLSPAKGLDARVGYRKIRYCRQQARREGIDWIWIDTCCIDKTSTAELSEAINSMFRWYQKAQVCYVYLSDVRGTTAAPFPEKGEPSEDRLLHSGEWFKTGWFKRGWTLQELLAPINLVFYTSDWNNLGTKAELCDLISGNTGIEREYLMGGDLEMASVSKKMSWAAGRKTSRIEDVTYCLLGIFDVNMPLIYGEGRKAFTRLQHEIMKILPHDHTLFAWGDIVEQSSIILSDQETLWGNKFPPWNQEAADRSLHGLLAKSPDDFEKSGSFAIHHDAFRLYHGFNKLERPTLSYKGVHIQLPVQRTYQNVAVKSVYYQKDLRMTQLRPNTVAALFCKPSFTDPSLLAVSLQIWGVGTYARTRELLKIPYDNSLLSSLEKDLQPMCIEPERHQKLQDGDLIFRRLQYDLSSHTIRIHSRRSVRYLQFEHSWRVDSGTEGRLFLFNFEMVHLWRDENLHGTFCIAFGRNQRKEVTVEVIPIVRGTSRMKSVEINGLKWHAKNSEGVFTCPFRSDTDFGVVMDIPRGKLCFEVNPFPRISVKVEKRQLADSKGVVDVIDLKIDPPSNTLHKRQEIKNTVTDHDIPKTAVRPGLRGSKLSLPRTISKNPARSTRRMKTKAKGILTKRITRRKSILIQKSSFPTSSLGRIKSTRRRIHPALRF